MEKCIRTRYDIPGSPIQRDKRASNVHRQIEIFLQKVNIGWKTTDDGTLFGTANRCSEIRIRLYACSIFECSCAAERV